MVYFQINTSGKCISKSLKGTFFLNVRINIAVTVDSFVAFVIFTLRIEQEAYVAFRFGGSGGADVFLVYCISRMYISYFLEIMHFKRFENL